MVKALFMDFYGTIAYEIGPVAVEVIKDIYKNSKAESMEEVTKYWWKIFRDKLKGANGKDFQSQHDVALICFQNLKEHFACTLDPEKLLERMEVHWCTSPLYEDAMEFLNQVFLPVYFVTNCDDRYVMEEIKKYDLKPDGVITSEQAGYSKPRKEIFLYALKKAGLHPEEAIHIGDSLESDVRCPASVGIRSIWLNREGKPVPDGVMSAANLQEALTMLEQISRE